MPGRAPAFGRTAMRRAGTVAAGAAALCLALALPASAHVTINPGTAEQGSFSKAAFRVPNERADAATTRVEVTFPKDHPLAFVSVRPVPGWQVQITETRLNPPVKTKEGELTEAVGKVTWSGGRIEPGQFQEFEVSMGVLPDNAASLAFPTTQTYSSGEVVNWADAPKPDGTEPEHPAPLLKLVPKAAATPSPAPARPAAAPDTTTRALSIAALVAALLGAATGILALTRTRR
ncbi:DUF1775 domain-containing protein [Bailinhaonella thermotolerans]|uniref:DUF1775 domain-containing protein n=2 Tax=Bailinhaonella thermotolerans TaxID=1070861 RepID=A0A3A4AWS0_9ACTN|nr:DUF1775 domain-containing protein [Bailinhaonella thermotolerans]